MSKILGLIFLLFSIVSYSQKTTTLFFHLDKKIEKYKTVGDSIYVTNYKKKAYTSFQLQGYIGIQIIDSTYKKNETHYWLTFGKHFKKIILSDSIKRTTTTFVDTYSQISKKLKILENTGYPFAKLIITNQEVNRNKLLIYYKIDSSDFVDVDKIHLKSIDQFNTNTILNLIDLKVGEPYSENKLRRITKILNASELYKTIREPEVLFKKGKAEIFIYFKKEKSSSADGYIGLLQDKTTQKISLNGYINLHLKNALNKGELINLNWKSNPDKTQNLKLTHFSMFANTNHKTY